MQFSFTIFMSGAQYNFTPPVTMFVIEFMTFANLGVGYGSD